MKDFLRKSKEFVLDNKDKVQPTLHFVGKCIEQVATVTQISKPTTYSYFNAAFKCKESYDTIFKKSDEDYFSNKKWERFLCHECWSIIIQLLTSKYSDRIRVVKARGSNSSSAAIFSLPLGPGVSIGWMMTGHTYIDTVYVTAGKGEEAKVMLSSIIWSFFKTKSVFLDLIKTTGGQALFSFKDDNNHNTFISSSIVTKYGNEIKQFATKGFGRSMLFYGPPGSGKSNLVRGIANTLDMKTLRVQNLNDIRNRALAEVIELLQPDVIILEDVDHIYTYELSSLLEKIEDFNRRNKYVLATANVASKINNALLRPGRFDQLVEICHMDHASILELVKNDQEIFEIVKDFPVAFINEVMKRVDSLGREYTLASIDDIKKRVEKFKKEEYIL